MAHLLPNTPAPSTFSKHCSSLRAACARALQVAGLLALLGATAPALAAVQISQIYGGGGNNGGVFNADFVELRNTGAAAVSVQGWSLQYASATGSNWGGAQLTALSGSIPAG